VTPAAIRALEEVIADLAATEDCALFARRWEHPPQPLREVEVRPWNADVAGGADVIFADGAGPSIRALEVGFGPFEEWPQLFSGTRVRAARRHSESAPAVELLVYGPAGDDDPLDRVSLYREWAPPGGWDAS
jgi:hypothetical protein